MSDCDKHEIDCRPKVLLRPESEARPVEKSEQDYIDDIDRKKQAIAKRKQDERFTAEQIERRLSEAKTREERVEVLRRALQYVPWDSLAYAKRRALETKVESEVPK